MADDFLTIDWPDENIIVPFVELDDSAKLARMADVIESQQRQIEKQRVAIALLAGKVGVGISFPTDLLVQEPNDNPLQR